MNERYEERKKTLIALFKKKFPSHLCIKSHHLHELVYLISKELANHNHLEMYVIPVDQFTLKSIEMSGGISKDLTIWVRGPYFSRREAVTIYQDGRVGFAGWASSTNVIPFMQGFMRWVADEL